MTPVTDLMFAWATVPHVNAPGWQVQPPTDWATLVGNLVDHDIRESKDGRLWAPVEVSSTDSRTNDSVRAVTMFVMDFDCGLSPEEAVQVLRDGGFAYVIHSSHRHTLAKPKFRVVAPLSRPIPLTDWREAWSYLHEAFGPASDVACKNPARIYFLPSAPPAGAFETYSDIGGGDPIDVNQVYHVIQERRDARARSGKTEGFARTGSIPVGKGDHRTVDLLAWLMASKVNARQEDGGEGKIFVDCPWKGGHTDGQQGPKDTYFLDKQDGGKPVFLCSHSHCKGHGWIDAANAIGGVDAFCAKEFVSPKSRQLERIEAQADTGTGPTVQDSTDEEVAEAVEAMSAPSLTWAIKDGNGNVKCGVANAVAFLRYEFEEGSVRFNEFTRLLEVKGSPVQEATIARLFEHLELSSRQTKWSRSHIDNALTRIASQVPQYHPVREYLDGLEWDGVPRIGELAGSAIRLEGETQVIHRAYLNCFFISAVARIMRPGCKVDTALVLQGPQGVRKSSFFRSLVPVERWFTDDMGGLENKDASMAVGRTWIVEWAELESVRRSNTGSVKAFLTRQTDSFRPPYGRLIEDFPRASVIVGTTNEDQFLQDATGNRRYMVLPVEFIDTDAVELIRDQLWAEAVARFKNGEPWWLSADESAVQREKNADLVSEDPWESLIARWVPKAATWTTSGSYVTMSEILGGCLEIGKERRLRAHQMRVAQILAALGWKRERRMISGTQQWVYTNPNNLQQEFTDTF